MPRCLRWSRFCFHEGVEEEQDAIGDGDDGSVDGVEVKEGGIDFFTNVLCILLDLTTLFGGEGAC